jgi:hypothetical protein
MRRTVRLLVAFLAGIQSKHELEHVGTTEIYPVLSAAYCKGFNIRNVAPLFEFFADCIPSFPSSFPRFLNSIMESRKSFRTSPCFSLKKCVIHRKVLRKAVWKCITLFLVLGNVLSFICGRKLVLAFSRRIGLFLEA